jgi:outer membrane protein TolC
MMIASRVRFYGACASLLLLAGCAVGPRYERPPAPTPPAYKENTPEIVAGSGWIVAQPQDELLKGKWWELYQDPQLNGLEEQVSVSNQNVAAAAAAFLSARALVKEARAQYFPTVTAGPSITTSNGAVTRTTTTTAGTASTVVSTGSVGALTGTGAITAYSLPFDASYQPDLWGRIRNTVLTNTTGAQVSAADLENTRLTMQAEVAVNYFELRAEDALKQVLDSTVAAYQEALSLTRARYETGIDSDEDVAQAKRSSRAHRRSTRLSASCGPSTNTRSQRSSGGQPPPSRSPWNR